MLNLEDVIKMKTVPTPITAIPVPASSSSTRWLSIDPAHNGFSLRGVSGSVVVGTTEDLLEAVKEYFKD